MLPLDLESLRTYYDTNAFSQQIHSIASSQITFENEAASVNLHPSVSGIERLQNLPIVNRQLASFLKGSDYPDSSLKEAYPVDSIFSDVDPFSPLPPLLTSQTPSNELDSSYSLSELIADQNLYSKEQLPKEGRLKEEPPPLTESSYPPVPLAIRIQQVQQALKIEPSNPVYEIQNVCTSSTIMTTSAYSLSESSVHAKKKPDPKIDFLPFITKSKNLCGQKRKSSYDSAKKFLSSIPVSLPDELSKSFQADEAAINNHANEFPTKKIRPMRKNLKERQRREIRKLQLVALVTEHQSLKKMHDELQIKYNQQKEELEKLRKSELV